MMSSSKPLTSRKSLRGLSMFAKDGTFSNPTTPTTPGAPGAPGTPGTPGTPNRRGTPTRNDRNGRDRTERDTGRNGTSRRPGTPSTSGSGLLKVMEGTSAADVGPAGSVPARDAVRTERTADTVRRASSARTTQRTREPSQLAAQISRPPSRMPSIPGPSRQPNQPVTPSLLNPTVYTPPTREQRAAAAASRGGRNNSTSSAPGASHHLTSSVSFPAQGQPSGSMHRSRPSAPENGQRTNAWEDSTMASMFDDHESRDGHERQINGAHPPLVRGRHYSDTAFPRSNNAQAQYPAVTQQPKSARPTLDHDENLPFVIGEGGILTVIEAPRNRNDPDAVALNKTIEAITKEREPTIKIEDEYEADRAAFNSTPTKQLGAFQRTRLPHRDPRKGGSARGGQGGYTSDVQQSPGMSSDTGADLEKSRIEQRLRREREHERLREQEREKERIRKEAERRERERKRQHGIQHQRSTVFDDLTPVESEAPPLPTPNFNNTQAAVVPSSSGGFDLDVSSPGNVTPKASGSRHLDPSQIPKQQPLPPQLKDASIALARTTSRRAKEKEVPKPQHQQQQQQKQKPATSPLPILEQAKKRRLSTLDYDDAQLYKMPYTTLLTQSFDEDPQEEAEKQQAQATTKLQQDDRPPADASLEDKLQHYKTKPTAQQADFFTHMKIDEWDDAGDWFLDQFTTVVKRIKDARRAKRKMVENFEVEIAEREGAVRGKIEKIGRTLENLKEEGKTMMQGKEMDLED
ncbi:extracellular mutant protein 11-domain-containing protein [Pseudoneurospora amorphoporcata]|uniref:Extracellular mutant protein 11-domain-containing protein n=1 Tax=Pseudoneurospora amorphoporcata TaxID=241081 RepID=A0AAN6SD05_9PEZI|nr:extracellular mutant protein 11-domain-containing protein [Pseudoneurospora amorphoporcata]